MPFREYRAPSSEQLQSIADDVEAKHRAVCAHRDAVADDAWARLALRAERAAFHASIPPVNALTEAEPAFGYLSASLAKDTEVGWAYAQAAQVLELAVSSEGAGEAWERAAQGMTDEFAAAAHAQRLRADATAAQHRIIERQLAAAQAEMRARHDAYMQAKDESRRLTREANRLGQLWRFQVFDWDKPLLL